MKDLGIELNDIICGLSADVGHGLHARAADAVDETFAGDDLRELAIRYVMDRAKGIARFEVARKEREATEHRRRKPPEKAVSTRPDEEGHIGKCKPGSASKYNECNICTHCRASWAREREFDKQERAILKRLTDNYEEHLRKQLFTRWTTQLLSSEIAMPDGVRTTWGEATVVQHKTRHSMLIKNVQANAESAVRHSQAIEDLTASGAPNLAAYTKRQKSNDGN